METKEKNKTSTEKTEAKVKGNNVGVSMKQSMAICDFIKGRTIEDASKELEKVTRMERAIPMKGEVPHRKGDMTGGRYPIKAAKIFIKLLKSLEANANNQGLDAKNIKLFAKADKAPRSHKPGKYSGRKFKRAHILITAK